MRYFFSLIALVCSLSLPSTVCAADVSLAKLQGVDPETDLTWAMHGCTVFALFFSTEDGDTMTWMTDNAGKLQTEADKSHKPLRLMLVTPDVKFDSLPLLIKNMKLQNSLVVCDPTNQLKIDKKNPRQVRLIAADGSVKTSTDDPVTGFAALAGSPADQLGTFRYTPPTDSAAMDWWWDVERGRPLAIKALTDAAKIKKNQSAAEPLVATVTAALDQRQKTLVEAVASMGTVEQLEYLLIDAQTIPLPEANKRLKILLKDRTLANELATRENYRKIAPMLRSPKQSVNKDGKVLMEQLIKKFGDTVYGRKGAELMNALAPKS